MEANTSRVIGTAGLIAVGVGTLNSFYKDKKPPSMRFLVGSGAAFVILSAIGEGEPEVAKALAIAVATTVVIGDGGGVLSYISNGEIDTKKGKNVAEDGDPLVSSADLYQREQGPFTPDGTNMEDEWQEDGAVLNPNSTSINSSKLPSYKGDLVGYIPGIM